MNAKHWEARCKRLERELRAACSALRDSIFDADTSAAQATLERLQRQYAWLDDDYLDDPASAEALDDEAAA